MIDEDAYEKALMSSDEGGARGFLEAYLFALPKPSQPYDQAKLYRQMTGMEM